MLHFHLLYSLISGFLSLQAAEVGKEKEKKQRKKREELHPESLDGKDKAFLDSLQSQKVLSTLAKIS